LLAEQCTHAVLESTGTYWKPIFNVLEDSVAFGKYFWSISAVYFGPP
jgi:hypothetical protein